MPSTGGMPPTAAADQLRRRAETLHGTAAALQQLTALGLHLLAGPETWVGPSPQSCLQDLCTRRNLLLAEADALEAEARRFRRVADEIDAQAATASGVQ